MAPDLNTEKDNSNGHDQMLFAPDLPRPPEHLTQSGLPAAKRNPGPAIVGITPEVPIPDRILLDLPTPHAIIALPEV